MREVDAPPTNDPIVTRYFAIVTLRYKPDVLVVEFRTLPELTFQAPLNGVRDHAAVEAHVSLNTVEADPGSEYVAVQSYVTFSSYGHS
jgi:hypothetical protein